jgi:hypothetical protein
MTGAASEWVDVIVGEDDPATSWKHIFVGLRDLALQSTKPGVLDKATVAPDRLLANAAWSLWDDFHNHAVTVVDELKHFWVQTSASGTAILVLDALSLRELPIIISARVKIDRITARERGVMRRSKSRPPDSCFTRHGCLRG